MARLQATSLIYEQFFRKLHALCLIAEAVKLQGQVHKLRHVNMALQDLDSVSADFGNLRAFWLDAQTQKCKGLVHRCKIGQLWVYRPQSWVEVARDCQHNWSVLRF